MQDEIVFIINPISGKRNKGSIRKEMVDAFIREKGLKARSILTEETKHATDITRQALQKGAARIVSVGGDGTMNEIAKEMVGTNVPLGLVPMGSGNGLARHLHLPLRFQDALEVAIGDHVIGIDTGEVNGHPFFNVMGFGLDAEIGKRFNEAKGRGFLTYLKEGLKAIVSCRSSKYTLMPGDGSVSIDAFVLAIANSSQYGSNAYIAPDASLKDGKLNVVAIQSPGFLGTIDLFWRMFSKAIYGSRKVKAFCSERIRIKLSKPGYFHADGEIFECGEEIGIVSRPKSLLMALPSEQFA